MNKTFISLLTLASTLVTTPVMAQSNINDHVKLVQSIKQVGVNYYVNPSECDQEDSFGWYWPEQNEIVICQENKIKGSTKMVNWTEEDFDTLRHETHHMVQDCRDGKLQGDLNAVYTKPIELAKDVLSTSHIKRIVEAYKDETDHIIVMELEAFSVAAMNDPLEQVRDIQNYCM